MEHKLVRFAPPRPRDLLARLLQEPQLVTTVRSLEPPVFAKVVRHIGLEDSGEFLSMATSEQLGRALDEDVWQSECPGGDEVFALERFVLWLEILVEVGDGFAAERLIELPDELLTLGFHRQVLVIDIDALAVDMSAAAGEWPEQIEKALDGCLYHEIDQYRIIARRSDGWDSLLAVMLALDSAHHDFLVGLLERCCAASSEYIEDNGGLYDVLTSEEMVEADAAAERSDRRGAAGFIAPSDARAFLALAATTPLVEIVAATAADPVTRMYFRELKPRSASVDGPGPGARRPAALRTLLRDAGVLDEEPSPAFLSDGAASTDPAASLREALVELASTDPSLHSRRLEELAFLANVLCAGAEIDGRAYRPFEAAAAVVTIAGEGAEHLGGASSRVLQAESSVKLFRIGWRLRQRKQ